MRLLFFLLLVSASLRAQDITRVEYFFDTDPGFGNGISIPLTSAVDVSKDFIIPLTAVSTGFHTVHLRAKNLSGHWSLPLSRTVFVQVNTQSNNPFPLKKIEYFLDTDPGFGNAISLSVSTTQVDQTVIADLSAAAPGFHILYMRSQDINNQWSLPFTKPFFVIRAGSNIVALEYYYMDGATQSPIRIYNSFTPGKDLTIDFEAVLDGLLPNTSYQIHVTAINADGQRSAAVEHTFTTPAVICDPISAPTVIDANRCGPGSVMLSAAGAGATESYHWYAHAAAINPIANETSSTFSTPALTTTSSYYVAIVNGTCESSRVEVVATVFNCNVPPLFTTTSVNTHVGGVILLDLTPQLSDADNNLDITTLSVITPPTSGAVAFINNGILTVDYSGIIFAGLETIELSVCDIEGSCTTQLIAIEVVNEIEIYNAISPNGDFKNDFFLIRHIQLIPDTRKNRVSIYNRWGSLVFRLTDYNETDRVFTGLNTNGNELLSGIYFYKIEFDSGHAPIAGFLTLRK